MIKIQNITLNILTPIAVMIFLSSFALGDKTLDRAVYGIQNKNFDCAALLSTIDNSRFSQFRYSWLYNSFNNTSGDGLSCVREINLNPKTSLMQVHLINETCLRNQNCGQYEILTGHTVSSFRRSLMNKDTPLMEKIEAYIKESSESIFSTLNQNISCLISPSLESNLDYSSAKVLIALTAKHFAPRCKIVWNPVNNNKNGTKLIPNTIHELHGHKVKLRSPCIANLDGLDIDLSSRKSFHKLGAISINEAKLFLKKYSHCEAAFLWIAEDNCLQAGDFIDPRERKNCTTKTQHEELETIFKGK